LCTSAARLLLAVAIFVRGLRAAAAAGDSDSLGLSESSLSSRFRLLLRLLMLVGSVVAPKQPFDRPDDDACTVAASWPLPLPLAFALPTADGRAVSGARRGTITWLLPQMLDPIALSIVDDDA
jgi:hypothetical protein